VVTITEMSLVNNNAATQTITLGIKRSGITSRIFYSNSFAQYWQAHGGAGNVLQPGDSIEGMTTTASAVDFNIDGLVQT
jgi:hypothetical protein